MIHLSKFDNCILVIVKNAYLSEIHTEESTNEIIWCLEMVFRESSEN